MCKGAKTAAAVFFLALLPAPPGTEPPPLATGLNGSLPQTLPFHLMPSHSWERSQL